MRRIWRGILRVTKSYSTNIQGTSKKPMFHFKCSHNGWETYIDIKTADIQLTYSFYFWSGFTPKTSNKLPDLKTGVHL